MTIDKAQPFVIPTIDIAPYLKDPSSPEAQKIIADVRDACMNTGFFSLVGHGISKELQERVFNASKVFFALPLEEKRKLSAPPLLNRGYEQIGSQALQEDTKPDMKEVSRPTTFTSNPLQMLTIIPRATTSARTSQTTASWQSSTRR